MEISLTIIQTLEALTLSPSLRGEIKQQRTSLQTLSKSIPQMMKTSYLHAIRTSNEISLLEVKKCAAQLLQALKINTLI